MARYVVRANGTGGPVEFQEPITITAALAKAQELRDACFSHITLINIQTGTEITDVEALIGAADAASKDSA